MHDITGLMIFESREVARDLFASSRFGADQESLAAFASLHPPKGGWTRERRVGVDETPWDRIGELRLPDGCLLICDRGLHEPNHNCLSVLDEGIHGIWSRGVWIGDTYVTTRIAVSPRRPDGNRLIVDQLPIHSAGVTFGHWDLSGRNPVLHRVEAPFGNAYYPVFEYWTEDGLVAAEVDLLDFHHDSDTFFHKRRRQ